MKVLIAPLDWGLGHATRCVPIIREYLNQGAEVEIAVVKANGAFFREEFPKLRQRLAPSYNIIYPKHGYNMGLWLLKNALHLKKVIEFEHKYAENLVENHHYDLILSDNRFGFYSHKIKSIYMTHQRRIAFPSVFSSFENLGILWHNSIIKHFNEVWVPDFKEMPGLAGPMSHVKVSPRPVKYVGVLSRFLPKVYESKKQYQLVAIVSGVEPARERFEKKLAKVFAEIPGKHAIIQGKPSKGVKSWTQGNTDFFTHLPDEDFAKVVQSGNWIVSRGGYSTIMDLAVLGAKSIFVPTPGQYEQIILARHLSSAGNCLYLPEHSLTPEALKALLHNNTVKTLGAQKNYLLKPTIISSIKKEE